MGSGGRLCGKDNGLGSHGPESEYQSPDCRVRGTLSKLFTFLSLSFLLGNGGNSIYFVACSESLMT